MTFPTLTRAGQADARRAPPGSAEVTGHDPVLSPRPYLLKCSGSDLVVCASCARRIAPAADENQRWVGPPSVGPCGYYANLDEVGWVYGHGKPAHVASPSQEGDDQQ